jgi:RecA-family ATPase
MASGKGDGGNTAWSNTVRSRLYLERKKEENGRTNTDTRILSRKKANYARSDEDLMLHWQSGIFVAGKCFLSDSMSQQREKSAEECFLRLIDVFTSQGRNLSSSKNSSNYAPKLMTKNSEGGFSTRDMEGAMERLFRKNLIKIEAYGRGKNPAQKIVIIKAGELL